VGLDSKIEPNTQLIKNIPSTPLHLLRTKHTLRDRDLETHTRSYATIHEQFFTTYDLRSNSPDRLLRCIVGYIDFRVGLWVRVQP
jgi:hypothetical protein